MSVKDSNSEELTENPHIVYINRLQRNMIIVTDLLYHGKSDNNMLKKALLGLIDNLPDSGVEHFKHVIDDLHKPYVASYELEKHYREIHKWCYQTIFKDAFKARPLYSRKAHLSVPQPK